MMPSLRLAPSLSLLPLAALLSLAACADDGGGTGGQTSATAAGPSATVTAGVGASTAAATSATTGAGGGGAPMGTVAELVAELEAGGFLVQEGEFSFLDLSACCAPGGNCFGNNPSSPYATYRLPRAPGQTAPNLEEDPSGLSYAYRLRPDEAILFVGQTPPPAQYFGFTSYVIDRYDPGPLGRKLLFSSLGDTMNLGVISTAADGNGVFDATALMVHTADAGVEASMLAAIEAAGYPAEAVNLQTMPGDLAVLGDQDTDDTVGVLFRVALFEDAAAGAAFVAAPPATVLRVTPLAAPPPDPLPRPDLRPRGTGQNEDALAASLAELRAAILAANPTLTANELVTTPQDFADWECIEQEKFCAGDNRDTIYPYTEPFLLPPGPDRFAVVYGVNHATTGKATYSSFTLYAIEHFVGVVAVPSPDMTGSAEQYLPGHPDADQLYAFKLARDCSGEPFCLDIPTGCPGVDFAGLAVVAFRAYLEPQTLAAPKVEEILLDQVIRFSP